MVAEDYNREGVVRAPPSVRASPSAAPRPVKPERALEPVIPESEPPWAVLTGVAVFQCREKDCKQVLSVMHQGRQEGERLRPVRSLNDDDCIGTGSLKAHEQAGEGRRVGRAGRQEGHKSTLEPGPVDAAFQAGVHLSRLSQGRVSTWSWKNGSSCTVCHGCLKGSQ